MLSLRSAVSVPGLTGTEITTFLSECTDAQYQQWWPGVHLHLVPIISHGDDTRVGDELCMDEYIGRRHLRMTAVVVDLEPGRRIVWQMKKAVRLPVWLTIDVADHDDGAGVDIRHTITAGFSGLGRALDPLLRMYFTKTFADAMDRHVQMEFPLLRKRLHPSATRSHSS